MHKIIFFFKNNLKNVCLAASYLNFQTCYWKHIYFFIRPEKNISVLKISNQGLSLLSDSVSPCDSQYQNCKIITDNMDSLLDEQSGS